MTSPTTARKQWRCRPTPRKLSKIEIRSGALDSTRTEAQLLPLSSVQRCMYVRNAALGVLRGWALTELVCSCSQMDPLAQLDATQALMTLLGGEVLVAGKDNPQLCQPSVPLVGLQPILLSELRVDEWHSRRVLYGTLRADAVKLGQNLVTIIVDDAGNSAKMMIQNVTLSSTPSPEASRLYAHGIRVAVKEPCFENGQLLEDDVTYVNVQSAAHIEIVSSFSPERLETLEKMDAQVLRDEGNREFVKKNFVAAKELYTLSIRKASKEDSFDKDCLLLAYSNRAECQLKLNKFHKAARDADRALGIDSSNTKALYRKGRALTGMQEYRMALESLQIAHDKLPEDKRLETLVAKLRDFNQQSQGIYDLARYFLSGSRKQDAPELGEYVGPVEIRLTRDGQRRGLFATKDLKPGELLTVCNARGLVDGFGPNKVLDSACMVIKAAIDSPRVLQQLKLLAVQFNLVDIRDAPGGRGDVSMSLFRPNGQFKYDEAQYTEVNVDDIFDIERLSRKRRGSEEYGFWSLPDFINHSCIGNVSDVRVGSAKLFRANRDVAAGEELTYCYLSSCTPLASRQKEMHSRSMDDCSCKRCTLETALQIPLQSINKKFGMVGDNVRLIRDPRKLSRLAIELEKKLKDLALTWEEVQWLRASYARLYVAYYSQTGGLEKMPSVEVFVEALLHSAPGSFVSVAIIAKLGPSGDDTMFSLVKQAFDVRYGVQEPSVISAILEQIARGAGEAALLTHDPLNTAEPVWS